MSVTVERKLTVVQVLPNLEGGGVERGTLEVAQELVRCGHQSWVISGGGQLVSRLTGQGSRHLQWPIGEKSLWTLRWVRRLREFLREQRVDILHARSRMPAWVAYRAWKGMPEDNRPHFVTTVHGLYSVSRYSAVMTRGEKVIAVSDTARRYILDNYPRVEPGRIELIHRGVDPAVFPHGYRPADSWYQRWFDQHPFLLERFVLTLPGRLTRLKGHLDFVQLMERLLADGQAVHGLVVGGEDPRRQRYARQVREDIARRGLQERISFIGHRMDMRDIYAASNVVLSLSRKPESFGRTVLEALYLGVPVLGYDHGGVGEVLGELFPQGRVPLGDIEALAGAVREIHAQRPEVPPTRAYDLQRMLDATVDLYTGMAAGGGSELP